MRNSEALFIQAPFGNESTSASWKKFRSNFKLGKEIPRQVYKKILIFFTALTESVCDMVTCMSARNYSEIKDIIS